MSKTDEELLTGWSRDPQGSFRLLYDRYAGVLLRFVFRFTGNQEQAEEILHDVFTEVLRELPTLSRDQNLKAWLFTVAKNKSLNFERRKKRETPSEQVLSRARDAQDLEEQISENQLLRQLKSYQDRLPLELANTWALRRQGLDYQQISDHLKIPLGTVKSRFSRLTEFFKKEFKIESYK